MSQLSIPSLCFELFEITGQKLYEVFEFVVHNPLISKIVNRKKRKDAKRKVIRNRSFNSDSAPRKRKRGERKAVFGSRAVSYIEDTENDLMFGADLMAEENYQLPDELETLMETPAKVTGDVDMNKIDQLELELQRLRSEMAKFMNPAAKPVEAPEPEVTPPPVSVAPPAPPPPPPVMPSSGKLSRVQTEPVAETDDEVRPTLSVTQLIAQGLVGPDKLRKVDGMRSPGGTIQRAATPGATPRNDPASIIALALQQKFKNVRGNHSIESSPEVSDRKRELQVMEPINITSEAFNQRLEEIESE